jgi:PhnB protein
LLNGNSEDEIRKWYDRLGKDGLKTHPIALTFWGALFGGLTDKFGNPWLLYYQQKNSI